jgi:putative intracellular protease/amidase
VQRNQEFRMQIAILTYDRMTALDAVGPYEVLGRLPGAEVVFVGARRGAVRTDQGSLGLSVDATLADVSRPDIVLVPGGPGQEDLMADEPTLDWLRRVDAGTDWTTSVCTGSLLLAAAGLMTGRRAASHWLARHRLADYGAAPVADRVVRDGKYLTAAGVSAGIDMALSLADWLAGPDVAQTIQLTTEYAPQPPFHAGSPDTAPGHLVEAMRAASRHTTLTP